MNKNIKCLKGFTLILSTLIILGVSSCRKYNSLNFTPGTSAPTITSVHTLSKTDTTSSTDTVTTYDTSGNISTTVNAAPNQIEAFDSITDEGNVGQYYVIYGTNLGSTTTVSFNGVSVYFNRAWVSDKSIIVLIPSNVPTFGPQATDTLTVATLHGEVNYKFTVLTPPPTISSVSDYDFGAGTQITLTGVGFASVSSVGLTGTDAKCTIVNQSDAELVLQFPSATINRANLVFYYTSNGNTVTVNSPQEFVDIDNAYQIFAKDNYQNSWNNNSWASPSGISTAAYKTGTASFQATFPAGKWQMEGFAANAGVAYSADYKYLSFWVKGGTVDHTLSIETFSQVQADINHIDVPPSVWTYFKIPLSTLTLTGWAPGSSLTGLAFFLKGQDGDVDETYYFDDVMLVK